MKSIQRISNKNDLAKLAGDINQAIWDKANDIAQDDFTEASLQNFFERSPGNDTYFLACYEGKELMGFGFGFVLHKPHSHETWLYIDELDVAASHRRKGVGKALMQEFFAIAKEKDCEEVWLGAEADDKTANAFYKSLNPTETEPFVGYTFKVEK